jgi:hypothetical protein
VRQRGPHVMCERQSWLGWPPCTTQSILVMTAAACGRAHMWEAWRRKILVSWGVTSRESEELQSLCRSRSRNPSRGRGSCRHFASSSVSIY